VYKFLTWFALCGLLYAGEGKVSIRSASLGALVYVDGVEMGKISKAPLFLTLPEGKHELMVSHILDEDWQEVQRQKIILNNDEILRLEFSLDLEKLSKKTNKNAAENFTKKDAVVIDKVAHLMWQDNSAVVEVKKNWFDAAQYCKSLRVNGFDDWYLPSYDALISIADYTKHTLAVMPAFTHVVSEYYWSASEDEKEKQRAKSIYFGNGCPDSKPKNESYYVRCVRTVK